MEEEMHFVKCLYIVWDESMSILWKDSDET